MWATVTFADVGFVNSINWLCQAHFKGTGKGWEVSDRPNSGDVVVTSHDSKAKARRALLAAARAHSNGLKIGRVCEQEEGHTHE